jgi:hypothetical protein
MSSIPSAHHNQGAKHLSGGLIENDQVGDPSGFSYQHDRSIGLSTCVHDLRITNDNRFNGSIEPE